MPTNAPTTIERLTMIRKIIGFAKAGVVAHESLVRLSAEHIAGLTAQGQVDAQALQSGSRLLTYLNSRVLPSEASCRVAMADIDTQLLPLRQQQRAEALTGQREHAPVRVDEQAVTARERG